MVCDFYSSVFHTALTITGGDQAQKFRATLTLDLLRSFTTLHITISHIYTFITSFYFKHSRSLLITPSMVLADNSFYGLHYVVEYLLH
jgi:hypothetical protein